MKHQKHPIFLFRGDDTDFIGNKTIAITIETDIDLSGITAKFTMCGFEQQFNTETVATKRFEVVIPHEETKKFPLGLQKGSLIFTDSSEKIKHVTTEILFFVSDTTKHPQFCGDEVIDVKFGEEINWSQIRNTPTTLAGYRITDAVKSVNGNLPDENGNVEVETGGGGTTDYDDLDNKPSINSVTLSGNKTAADLGLATVAQGAKADTAYQKPQAGIPASDMAQAVRASLDKADSALQSAPVESVNGKTGVVALTASDIGALSNQGGNIGDGMIRAGLPSDKDEYAELASDGITVYYYGSGGRWVVTYYGSFAVNVDGNISTFQRKSGTLAFLSDIPSVAGLAPLASPAFTGTPTAPTPAAADNSTKVATTAFVKTAISGISVTPLSGQTFNFATTQGVMDALKATIEALGGTVTNAPTPPAQNNQTQGE